MNGIKIYEDSSVKFVSLEESHESPILRLTGPIFEKNMSFKVNQKFVPMDLLVEYGHNGILYTRGSICPKEYLIAIPEA